MREHDQLKVPCRLIITHQEGTSQVRGPDVQSGQNIGMQHWLPPNARPSPATAYRSFGMDGAPYKRQCDVDKLDRYAKGVGIVCRVGLVAALT